MKGTVVRLVLDERLGRSTARRSNPVTGEAIRVHRKVHFIPSFRFIISVEPNLNHY